jgi:alpha-L-fucosidase
MDSYLKTVGRNSNLLLNISPNTNGTIDDVDMHAYKQLGDWINRSFATPLRQQTDIVLSKNTTVMDVSAVGNFS